MRAKGKLPFSGLRVLGNEGMDHKEMEGTL